MKLPPYVTTRKGSKAYWFRRRVPDSLIPIVGRGEFMESLRTRDVVEARGKAAFRNAEVEALFAHARLAHQRQAGMVLQQPPTVDEQDYIRDAIRVYVLEEDEAVRLARPDDESMDAYEGIRADQFEDASSGLRSGRVAWGRLEKERIGKLLQAVGVKVEPNTTAWELAAFRATEGLHRALKDIGSRINGDFVSTPVRPILPASFAPESVTDGVLVTLGDVIDNYEKGLRENDFRRKVVRCLQLFGEMLGHKTPVSELRQKAVTQFMRDICRLPVKWSAQFDAGETIEEMLAEEPEKVMSPTTYEANYRGPLGTFLKKAARDYGDDGFRLFTVEGIDYTGNRVAEEDQQRALEPVELVTLFEGEEFRKVANDPTMEPLYWLYVVMLFTGARPREVCQLNPQVDFGPFEGHWYIDLAEKTAAGKGVKKSIKSGETRRLPLHAQLVRLGFPEYLQRLKDANADRLFPTWRMKKGNPYTAHYKLVAGLLKSVGLYTREAPPSELVTGAYVLRKTFITQCRNQGVVSKEVTGHSDGTTTAVQDKSYIFGPEPFHRKLAQLSKLVMPVNVPMPQHRAR